MRLEMKCKKTWKLKMGGVVLEVSGIDRRCWYWGGAVPELSGLDQGSRYLIWTLLCTLFIPSMLWYPFHSCPPQVIHFYLSYSCWQNDLRFPTSFALVFSFRLALVFVLASLSMRTYFRIVFLPTLPIYSPGLSSKSGWFIFYRQT